MASLILLDLGNPWIGVLLDEATASNSNEGLIATTSILSDNINTLDGLKGSFTV